MRRVKSTRRSTSRGPPFPVMKRQGYGRFVFTTSGRAMAVERTRPGLAAYVVGKLAHFGLMIVTAAEGEPHGILANAVAPAAATRMLVRSVEPGELEPEQVAPGVVFLASSACTFTGQGARGSGRRIRRRALDVQRRGRFRPRAGRAGSHRRALAGDRRSGAGMSTVATDLRQAVEDAAAHLYVWALKDIPQDLRDALAAREGQGDLGPGPPRAGDDRQERPGRRDARTTSSARTPGSRSTRAASASIFPCIRPRSTRR